MVDFKQMEILQKMTVLYWKIYNVMTTELNTLVTLLDIWSDVQLIDCLIKDPQAGEGCNNSAD